VENYDLQKESGKGYDLNVSLFERLVMQGYPCATLSMQHRMHPEISHLIRGTYPNLLDSPTVSNHPAPRGMIGRLAFINHTHLEGEENDVHQIDGASFSNLFEAEMIAKLVKYFSKQGYKEEQITVLTPYLGQLRLIANMMKAEVSRHDQRDLSDPNITIAKNKGIRVATVDNYQGEESDIIIISTVRNNSQRRMGFLGNSNRVNVLLSRARHGMVILGCESFLRTVSSAEAQSVWVNVLDRIGPSRIYRGFPAFCTSHQVKSLPSTPAEFDSMCPDGGCATPCSTKLSCSHPCPLKCHSSNYDHKIIKCSALIFKNCPSGHEFSWKCAESPVTACPTCTKIEDDRRKEEQKRDKERKKRAAQQAEMDRMLVEAQRAVDAEAQRVAQEQALLDKQEQLRDHQEALKKLQDTHPAPQPSPAAVHPSPAQVSATRASTQGGSVSSISVSTSSPFPSASSSSVPPASTSSSPHPSDNRIKSHLGDGDAFSLLAVAIKNGDAKKALEALKSFNSSDRQLLFEKVPQLPTAFVHAASDLKLLSHDAKFMDFIIPTISLCLEDRHFEASKTLSSSVAKTRCSTASAQCTLDSFFLLTQFKLNFLDKENCNQKILELMASGKSNSSPPFVLAMIYQGSTSAAWYALLFLWMESHSKSSFPSAVLAESEKIFRSSCKDMLSPSPLAKSPQAPVDNSPAAMWKQIRISRPLAQQVLSMDALLKLSSIKEVKLEMINVFNQFEVAKEQGQSSKLTYHAIFEGNPVRYHSEFPFSEYFEFTAV